MPRTYPEITESLPAPTRPISFVVIIYSNEYLHNFSKSECVDNTLNQVVAVDNIANLYYDNLSKAIIAGLESATHELIVVVHEDVLLPRNWQSRFERSLAALEAEDPDWGMAGSVGWRTGHRSEGHWSDPHQHKNTFETEPSPFKEVDKLDEQLLVFRRSNLPVFDAMLPGIHFLGEDLIKQQRAKGQKNYIINAPTIHKYANKHGALIQHRDHSEKIRDRERLTYQADYAVCEDYQSYKWHGAAPSYSSQLGEPERQVSDDQLDAPVIFLSRGGSGSRIVSFMAQATGVVLGNQVNDSGDSVEFAIPFYKTLIEKYACAANWQKHHTAEDLRNIARFVLGRIRPDSTWGIKLPESAFILTEISAAFPRARYVHFVRDPLATCLRRTHMTARLDNHIGRITLPAAYDFLGRPSIPILEDSSFHHMAYTTLHQLDLINAHLDMIDDRRKLQIKFEDTIKSPKREAKKLRKWLELPLVRSQLRAFAKMIDPKRTITGKSDAPAHIEREISEILDGVRRQFDYR